MIYTRKGLKPHEHNNHIHHPSYQHNYQDKWFIQVILQCLPHQENLIIFKKILAHSRIHNNDNVNFAKFGANKPPQSTTPTMYTTHTTPSSIPKYLWNTHIPRPSGTSNLTFKYNAPASSQPTSYHRASPISICLNNPLVHSTISNYLWSLPNYKSSNHINIKKTWYD